MSFYLSKYLFMFWILLQKIDYQVCEPVSHLYVDPFNQEVF